MGQILEGGWVGAKYEEWRPRSWRRGGARLRPWLTLGVLGPAWWRFPWNLSVSQRGAWGACLPSARQTEPRVRERTQATRARARSTHPTLHNLVASGSPCLRTNLVIPNPSAPWEPSLCSLCSLCSHSHQGTASGAAARVLPYLRLNDNDHQPYRARSAAGSILRS